MMAMKATSRISVRKTTCPGRLYVDVCPSGRRKLDTWEMILLNLTVKIIFLMEVHWRHKNKNLNDTNMPGMRVTGQQNKNLAYEKIVVLCNGRRICVFDIMIVEHQE